MKLGPGISLLIAACAGGAAQATESAPSSTAAEAAIPFVHFGAIRTWAADRDEGLWVQDSRRRWYYAKFMGRCPGVRSATTLGFDTRPMGTFDRFSAVLVPRWGRCMVRSLVASEGPPSKKKKGNDQRIGDGQSAAEV